MAKRCKAVLVGDPKKGEEPIRRCKAIAGGRKSYCVVHQPHRAHFDALLHALGDGWEARVPGADAPLTPRSGWKQGAPPVPERDASHPSPAGPPPQQTDARRQPKGWSDGAEASRKRMEAALARYRK